MTWLELGPFIGLAVLTNTAFPMPFEPVLLAFGGGRTGSGILLVCALGSVAAAAGALVDAGCFGFVRRGVRRLHGGSEQLAGPRFYLLTAGAGLLPIPFSVVRAALVRVRPRSLVFAGIVGVTRFPRYLATVYAWKSLALPEWAGWVVAGTAGVVALEISHRGQLRRRTSAGGRRAPGA